MSTEAPPISEPMSPHEEQSPQEDRPSHVEHAPHGESHQSFESLLATLEIPPNIDPRLLALWIEREQEKWEEEQKDKQNRKKKKTRSLGVPFAAFIGITAMCLTILLGIVQGTETNEILIKACQIFLIYTVIGLAVGLITEFCVVESAETLLREVIRRGHEAEQLVTEQLVTGQSVENSTS